MPASRQCCVLGSRQQTRNGVFVETQRRSGTWHGQQGVPRLPGQIQLQACGLGGRALSAVPTTCPSARQITAV